ncbi:thioredoxin family protein [Halobacillus amylolyticus]|uniref:Thioredoxin family protein n=1 Tax=Halobacillus amylolyticus TaxID=2932259 RepID=A0ABY4HE81_9BACI|nr:thioredoxin family protein [Halobacillus amylolyticus]UOR13195.1 thioredoxin family protein [Halobacillus amylolyticus]
MKKNMIIFGTILVALLVVLAFVVNYQNSQKAEGNPYGKSNLEQATIEQLDDPNYQNQILPDELEKQINSGEPTTVYFYSPECVHCQRTTPVLVPIAQEMGIDMKKLNLLEFSNQWQEYGIEATPTLVHYENGEEVARIVGSQEEATFKDFFQQEVLTNTSEQQ